VEEKLKEYKESSKVQVAEWKRDMEALDALALSQRAQWNAAAEETEARITGLGADLAEKASRAEQRILTETEKRLVEYRDAQAEQWERFAKLADDAGKLDGQLRIAMADAQERVRGDFALFEEAQKQDRERTASGFGEAVRVLRDDMAAVEQELNALKNRAYENVSQKLKLFEDDFFADLSRRDNEIDTRLDEWHSGIEGRLGSLGETAEAERRILEQTYGENLKRRLEDLTGETGAFEESIRANMVSADTALESLRKQLEADLEDARTQAENAAKTEIGRYSLGMNEALKTNQRELEEQLKEIAGSVEDWNSRIKETEETTRRDVEAWQSRFSSQLREAENSLEDARRRTHDLVSETDERIAQVKSGIDEASRHISEFTTQTRLFDKADELRLALERRMEDLKGDLSGLDQRRAEAAQLEAQFVKIRRLEDEVNSKMTRFLSEKHRLEVMEKDFNKLIQTSQAVEEKLRDVTNSDDILQTMQVQLHKLEDAIKDAEEKFQRLEKKNQVLDATADGIDKNYKLLEETETALKRCSEEIEKSRDELDSFQPSIEKLAAADKEAKAAVDKLSLLDTSLTEIEERIQSMQTAREWLARAETRFEELNKETQEMVRFKGALQKEEGRKSGSGTAGSKGAPPIAARENVIKLARQGWGADEIARTLKLSRGEVDLILELGIKD
jgi:DNA repair exonuclease SbcCD ATPase subunit